MPAAGPPLTGGLGAPASLPLAAESWSEEAPPERPAAADRQELARVARPMEPAIVPAPAPAAAPRLAAVPVAAPPPAAAPAVPAATDPGAVVETPSEPGLSGGRETPSEPAAAPLPDRRGMRLEAPGVPAPRRARSAAPAPAASPADPFAVAPAPEASGAEAAGARRSAATTSLQHPDTAPPPPGLARHSQEGTGSRPAIAVPAVSPAMPPGARGQYAPAVRADLLPSPHPAQAQVPGRAAAPGHSLRRGGDEPSPPAVQVRIGRVEIQAPKPGPAQAPPRPSPAPATPPFADHTLARSHLDRCWW